MARKNSRRGKLELNTSKGPAATRALLSIPSMAVESTGVRSFREIRPRAGAYTRELKATHVLDLAKSIAALGLLEPIVIDVENFLLAGAHRLAACKLLQSPPEQRASMLASWEEGSEISPEMFSPLFIESNFDADFIPVRVLSFRSVDDPDLALRIETTENEKRRDYTPSEIRTIFNRLKVAGYRTKPGKPKAGEKAARPLIATVIGKSERHVRRLLNAAEESEGGKENSPKIEVSKQEKSKRSLIRAAKKYLSHDAPVAEKILLQTLLALLNPPSPEEGKR